MEGVDSQGEGGKKKKKKQAKQSSAAAKPQPASSSSAPTAKDAKKNVSKPVTNQATSSVAAEEMVTMESFVEDAIADSIKLLFKNRMLLPAYPFKTFLSNMLRHEVYPNGLKLEARNYLNIPSHSLSIVIKIAHLGNTTFYASKHLAKLVSMKSLQYLQAFQETNLKAFGHLPNYLKTEKYQAVFLEVVPVGHAMSQTLVLPNLFQFQTTLEGILIGKSFEECVNVFIRRILEESHVAITHRHILSAHLTIKTSTNMQKVNISTMRAKRQQLLTLLKAAITTEGEIWLDYYLYQEHTLPVYLPAFTTYREPSSGFITCRRRYKFTYQDEKDNIRCFTKSPLESLSLGIFRSMEDANICVVAYLKHLERLTKSSKREDTNTAVDAMAPPPPPPPPNVSTAESEGVQHAASAGNAPSLVNFLNSLHAKPTLLSGNTVIIRFLQKLILTLSEEGVQAWNDGEICKAMLVHMQLYALFEANSSAISYGMNQCKVVLHSIAQHVHIIRVLIQALQEVVNLVLEELLTKRSFLHQHQQVAVTSDDDTNEIAQMKLWLEELIPSACLEIRQLILELMFVSHQVTTCNYLLPLIKQTMLQLFDAQQTTACVLSQALNTMKASIERRGFVVLRATLQQFQGTLTCLQGLCKTLEVNLAMEMMMSILAVDIKSYSLALQSTENSVEILLSRHVDDLPRCLMDLLGFMIEKVRLKGRSSNWRTLAISPFLQQQYASMPKQEDSIETELKALDLCQESAVHSMHFVWEFYGYLSASFLPRVGGINFQAWIQEEVKCKDVPTAIIFESSQLRYLQATSLLPALQKASFEMLTSSASLTTAHNTISVVPSASAFLRLHQHLLPKALAATMTSSDQNTMSKYLYEPIRSKQLKLLSKSMQEGPYKLPWMSTRRMATKFKNLEKLWSGGIIGCDRVLSCLSKDVSEVFAQIWNFPPLFASAPKNTLSIKVKVFGGVSMMTALQWTSPTAQTLKQIQSQHKSDKLASDQLTIQRLRRQSMINEVLQTSKDKLMEDEVMQGFEKEGKKLSPRASQSDSEPEYTNNNEKRNKEVDVDIDTGVLQLPVLPKLEVVFLTEYDDMNMLEAVQVNFGQEIVKMIQHLVSNSSWHLMSVDIISVASTIQNSSSNVNIKSEKRMTISIQDIMQAINTSGEAAQVLYRNIERLAGKAGAVEIEAGVKLAEAETAITTHDLISIFEDAMQEKQQKIDKKMQDNVHPFDSEEEGDSDDEYPGVGKKGMFGTRKKPVKPVNVDAPPSASQQNTAREAATGVEKKGMRASSQSPDVARPKGSALPSPNNQVPNPKQRRRKDGKPVPLKGKLEANQKDLELLRKGEQYKKASADDDNDGINSEEEEVFEEMNRSFDPTFLDADRLCADGITARLIFNAKNKRQQQHRAKAEANNRTNWKSVEVASYVPVVIRVTHIAQVNGMGRWKNMGNNWRNGGNQPNNASNLDGAGHIIGQKDKSISIGREEDIARLVASTIWFTKDAGKKIWSLVRRHEGEANAILYMAHHYFQIAKPQWREITTSSMEIYEATYMYAVLAQQYDLCFPLVEIYQSPVSKMYALQRITSLMSSILDAHVQSASSKTALDLHAVGLTITRHIDLGYKYLISSPAVLHLHGALAYGLKILDRLRIICKLTPIAIAANRKKLPPTLLHKPSLTEVILKDRLDFLRKNKGKSKGFWSRFFGADSNAKTAGDDMPSNPDAIQASSNSVRIQGQTSNNRPTDDDNDFGQEEDEDVEFEVYQHAVNLEAIEELGVLSYGLGQKDRTKPLTMPGSVEETEDYTQQSFTSQGYDVFQQEMMNLNTVYKAKQLLSELSVIIMSLTFMTMKDINALFHYKIGERLQHTNAFNLMTSMKDNVDIVLGSEAEIGSVIAYAQRAQSKTHMKLADFAFTLPVLDQLSQYDSGGGNTMHELMGSMSRVGSEVEFLANKKALSSFTSILSSLEAVHKFKTAAVLSKANTEEKVSSDQQMAMEEILGAVLKDKAGPVIEAFVPGRLGSSKDDLFSFSSDDTDKRKVNNLKGVVSAMRAIKRMNSGNNMTSNTTSTDSLNPNQANVVPLVDRVLQDNKPKSFLSNFHDDSNPGKLSVDHEPSLQPSFASSGFKISGDRMQQAVKTNSMLAVLRAYGGVQDSFYRDEAPYVEDNVPEVSLANVSFFQASASSSNLPPIITEFDDEIEQAFQQARL